MSDAREVHFADQFQALVDKHLDRFVDTARKCLELEKTGAVDPSLNLKDMATILGEIDQGLPSGYMLAAAIRRVAALLDEPTVLQRPWWRFW